MYVRFHGAFYCPLVKASLQFILTVRVLVWNLIRNRACKMSLKTGLKGTLLACHFVTYTNLVYVRDKELIRLQNRSWLKKWRQVGDLLGTFWGLLNDGRNGKLKRWPCALNNGFWHGQSKTMGLGTFSFVISCGILLDKIIYYLVWNTTGLRKAQQPTANSFWLTIASFNSGLYYKFYDCRFTIVNYSSICSVT